MPNNLWQIFDELHPAPAAQEQAPLNWPEPNQVPPQNNAAEQLEYNNYINKAYAKLYKNPPTGGRLASQWSDEYLDLEVRAIKLKDLIRQEQVELERALETIATQAEVVRDIGTQVRTHITTLQTVANRLETWRQNLPRPDSLGSATAQAGGRSVPVGADQPAGVGAQQVAPGLWQQGQE